MEKINKFPKRKPNRLKKFDYSQNGAYFVTICTKDKQCILSKIVGGGVLDAPLVELSDYGKIVDKQINTMNTVYSNISVEKYVIMPNHIHMLIFVDNPYGTSGTPSPTNAVIPAFVSTFKRFCNKQTDKKLFQRSFHDHIIRDDADYNKIWNYIDTNPAKWNEDCFFIE